MTKTFKAIPPLIALVSICVFVEPVRKNLEQIFFLFNLGDVDTIKGYILSFGLWAPVISFGFMLFQAVIVPLPANLITFANASLFGWGYGALLSWTSAMAGAALCFALARYLGREITEKVTSKFALQEIDPFFRQYGKYCILIARLLPFISFDVVSYAAGLTSMSFRSFFWATGVGLLPTTLLYSCSGEMLTGTGKTVVLVLQVLFAFSVLALFLIKLWQKKHSHRI